jgi:hypothetical protein
MDKKCAPHKIYNDGSCFTVDDLIEITNDYNKIIPQQQKIVLKKNKKYLLQKLTAAMRSNYKCNEQTCWIRQSFIKNTNIKNYTFRPIGPDTQFKWTTTRNINDVMSQYEKKYKDFKFYGAVPYDFENLDFLPTYKFNIKNLNSSNENQIGMVINLDPHNKKGSHWVSLYINRMKNQVYFFDSVGKPPGKRISHFIKKFYNDMMNKGLTHEQIDIRCNKKQHQFNDSECGIYSMNFIIRLLQGDNFDDIINNITNDMEMNTNRNIYFRNNNFK